MKILHNNGYSEEECKSYTDFIRSNILHSMMSLVSAAQKFEYPISDSSNMLFAQKINSMTQDDLLNIRNIYTEELASDLASLWKDEGIQKAYMDRNQFQLLDSTE
jgi:guanine nucleotide-binding protein G(i) subunit alpha